uniref:Uncharacterized protein n=1 Tax=Cucumis sativus TaxID=3659 RepID=A0A0A0KYK4_CUCSA
MGFAVFLTKHFRNRRLRDPEFVLDFEEIYVIDSKTKSITRAKVLVTVPGGRDRDRRSDLLVVWDNGNSFKIIHSSERDDPTTVIEKEEWTKTRQDMERHLRKSEDKKCDFKVLSMIWMTDLPVMMILSCEFSTYLLPVLLGSVLSSILASLHLQ